MGNLCCNCGDGSRSEFFINHPFFGLCCHYVILVFVGGIHFLQCLPSAATAISAEALFPSKWLSCQWEIEIFFFAYVHTNFCFFLALVQCHISPNSCFPSDFPLPCPSGKCSDRGVWWAPGVQVSHDTKMLKYRIHVSLVHIGNITNIPSLPEKENHNGI